MRFGSAREHTEIHARSFSHKHPSGPPQHHLENKCDEPKRREKESGVSYGALGWFLTASAEMLQKKKVTVRRGGECSASGSGRKAGRQAGIMQCSHGLVGERM